MGATLRRRLVALAGVLTLAGSLVGCPTLDYQVLDDVPYHPVDDADLVVGSWSELAALAGQAPAVADRVIDVHRADPAPPAGAPAIIYVPGGAWYHHDQSGLPTALVRYVEQGWVVLTIGYTRADAADPARQWQVQGQEVDWAVRWVKANAAALGVDDDKLVLAGHSAGAHLSAMVATARFDGPGNPILPPAAPGDPSLGSFTSRTRALVLLAGAYNLTAAGVPFSQGNADLGIPPHWPQQNLLGCNAAADPPNTAFPGLTTCSQARLDDASVVHAGVNFEAAHGNFPATLMVHAQDDPVATFGPNTFHLGVQLCNNDYPLSGGGTHRVPVSVEMLSGDDHQVTDFDYAKLDYFLFQQGLLGEVPVATTTWTCNQ